MYGQTNCFVLPEGDYGVWEMKNGEHWVASDDSMLNMSYQLLTHAWGEMKLICRIKGNQLLGMKVNAPLSHYKEVYVLPMLSIDMQKGTGIVTSVPSDSPDDYAVLVDFKKKEGLRKKFGITDEMV